MPAHPFADQPDEPETDLFAAHHRALARRRGIVLVGVLLALLISGGIGAYVALPATPGPIPVAASATTDETAPVGTPHGPPPPGQPPGSVRLPTGGTAKLVRRELDAEGHLPIPAGVDEATWWGSGLGAPHGAALLSGHIDWQGHPGPFAELWQDHAGQPVQIVDTTGRTWVYRVTQALTVPKAELAAQAAALFGQDGPHRLVLVTSGGEFVGGDEGYHDNRILIATLVARP